MTESYAKPLPAPDAETLPFWEGCREHELRAQRCRECRAFRWPPSPLCPECQSWEADWTRLSETGRVYSYVVVHYSALPAFQQELPYVVAQIAIDGTAGRVRLTSNLVGCSAEEVRVDMAVQVSFADVTPEVALPKFRPDQQGTSLV